MKSNIDIQMAGPLVTKEDEKYVLDAMRNGWYGEKAYYYCEKFEKEFAKYHDRKYALMTPNCTSAIHLILAGLGIGKDDEVIVPDCTWIASAAPITYVGAKPVFCDIEVDSWCLSVETISKVITDKTKAIISVDLFGNMPNYDALIEYCETNGIYLIEDSAESLGSEYKSIKAGKFGVASVFSFHRTKTLTTGEGGMLLIDDEKLFNRCKFLRDHGRDEHKAYYNIEVAYKYMPFNLQAALGYAQFIRVNELIGKKKWIFESFFENLKSIPDIYLNPKQEHVINGYWTPALVLGNSYSFDKETLMNEINKKGLPSRPFFYPLSSLPAYSEYSEMKNQNVNAYKISKKGINLPCAMNLTKDAIDYYSEELVNIINTHK